MSPHQRIRIWDLPTRLFHWLLVICIIGSFVSVNLGGFWMDYHFLFGYTILALLVFRLIWGFVGPTHARFTSFLRGPRRIAGYLRGEPAGAGHSPLGALSVIAMLLALTLQAVTGLFANDGILSEGPLVSYISNAWSDTLTGIHQANRIVIVVLVILHLLAIAWYTLVRKRPLVRAMVTGNKPLAEVPADTRPTPDGVAVWFRAAVVALVALALVWWIAAQGDVGF